MNKKRNIILTIFIILALILVFGIICIEKYGNNYLATLKAVVVKVSENSLLVMGTENAAELYSVSIADFKNMEFEKGQELLIYYSGNIMTSYPAQLGGVTKIEIVKKKSSKTIPDDIIRFAYNSKDKVKIDVSEITINGITLIITDKNELPYEYAHSYIINKKVKNEYYTGVGEILGSDTENSTSGFTRNGIRIYLARN